MSNMSYCRFENTDNDLEDCQDALEALMNDPRLENRLSDRELRAAKSLVDRCRRITEHIADYLNLQAEDLTESITDDALEGMNDKARFAESEEEEEEEMSDSHSDPIQEYRAP